MTHLQICKTFKKVTLLASLTLLVACHHGGSGSDAGTGDPEGTPPVEQLTSCASGISFDCDGDGLVSACDTNDFDAKVTTPVHSEHCDSDGDGFLDVTVDSTGAEVQKTCASMSESDLKDRRYLCDNCPIKANSDQKDSNGDGIGDECTQTVTDTPPVADTATDSDDDGLPDTIDLCKDHADQWVVFWATCREVFTGSGVNYLYVNGTLVKDVTCELPFTVTEGSEIQDTLFAKMFDSESVKYHQTDYQYNAWPTGMDVGLVSKASNYADIPEIVRTLFTYDDTRDVFGIFQLDTDGDGVGYGCDEDEHLIPSSFGTPNITPKLPTFKMPSLP